MVGFQEQPPDFLRLPRHLLAAHMTIVVFLTFLSARRFIAAAYLNETLQYKTATVWQPFFPAVPHSTLARTRLNNYSDW